VVANIGILAANGMALLLESLLSPSAFESYGWRIAFAVGGLMGMLILYWRRGLLETPAFLLLKAKSQIINAPFTAALRQVPGKMLLTISLVMLGAVLYYTCFIYLTTLLQQLGLSQSRIYLLQTTCLAAMIVLVPMGGWLCDIIGRKLSFLIISSGALLFTWPCFHWLASGHLSLIILALAIFTLLSSMEQGSTSATTAELFPTAMRYTGLSFSYNLTQALFGGTAPVVAASLVMLTHEPTAPSYYLIAIAAITFVCSLCFLSTKPAQSFS
jgi:MHS family proline/betaine transporter-like MFS transporter